ncbi:MAG TPA: tetratricopeptide repeat protein [Dehalococcoidia bacterium]|nr:tetratricopeptide repeat protein [Dehalococcoidia bacterium]
MNPANKQRRITCLAVELHCRENGRQRSVQNDGGRLGALDVFNVLGNDHEITREYTRRLSSLLF